MAAKVEEAFVLPESYQTGGRERFDTVVDLLGESVLESNARSCRSCRVLGETVYDRPEMVSFSHFFCRRSIH